VAEAALKRMRTDRIDLFYQHCIVQEIALVGARYPTHMQDHSES